ncbi:hypothetical protein OEZ86_000301 [Tetradesmus obliquus]|nr:hypothetical protein OEZ86_000301 [Tetradesmus obliquus]
MVAHRLLQQAASQVSPELAEQLRQHVLAQVEAAALLAAAAGTPFDMAATMHQLLPDLAQQVQQACVESVSCKAAAAAIASVTSAQHNGSAGLSAEAITAVATEAAACAGRAVAFDTSLTMSGYQLAAGSGSSSCMAECCFVATLLVL